MQIVKKGDVELITFDNLTQTGMVKHGFTTCHGGVSTGFYGTMNMGFSRGEDRAPVAENYRILARALELDENAFVANSADPYHKRTESDSKGQRLRRYKRQNLSRYRRLDDE